MALSGRAVDAVFAHWLGPLAVYLPQMQRHGYDSVETVAHLVDDQVAAMCRTCGIEKEGHRLLLQAKLAKLRGQGGSVEPMPRPGGRSSPRSTSPWRSPLARALHAATSFDSPGSPTSTPSVQPFDASKEDAAYSPARVNAPPASPVLPEPKKSDDGPYTASMLRYGQALRKMGYDDGHLKESRTPTISPSRWREAQHKPSWAHHQVQASSQISPHHHVSPPRHPPDGSKDGKWVWVPREPARTATHLPHPLSPQAVEGLKKQRRELQEYLLSLDRCLAAIDGLQPERFDSTPTVRTRSDDTRTERIDRLDRSEARGYRSARPLSRSPGRGAARHELMAKVTKSPADHRHYEYKPLASAAGDWRTHLREDTKRHSSSRSRTARRHGGFDALG